MLEVILTAYSKLFLFFSVSAARPLGGVMGFDAPIDTFIG